MKKYTKKMDYFNSMVRWDATELAFVWWATQFKGARPRQLGAILQRAPNGISSQLVILRHSQNGERDFRVGKYEKYAKALELVAKIELGMAPDMVRIWTNRLTDPTRQPGPIVTTQIPVVGEEKAVEAPPAVSETQTPHYYHIMEWLYVNDRKYPTVQEWRAAFAEFLRELLK
jgi:hypothetical protein